MSQGRLARLSALAVWAGGLALTVIVLVRLGHGALSAPPVGHGVAGLRRWIADRDAATVVMAHFRLAGLGMAAYLTATTALGVAVRLSGVPAAVRAADVFTVPLVRRILAGTVGVIVAVGPLVGPTGGFAATPDPTQSSTTFFATADDPPVMRRLPDGPGASTTTTPTTTTPTTTTRTMTGPRLGPTSTTATPPSAVPTVTTPAATTPATVPAPAAPVAALAAPAARAAAPPIVPPAALGTWTVRPGDHLWLIATKVAEHHTGTADARLVDRYWRAVIDLNRSSLPDPANPDLLFSGMEIRLPPLPA